MQIGLCLFALLFCDVRPKEQKGRADTHIIPISNSADRQARIKSSAIFVRFESPNPKSRVPLVYGISVVRNNS